MKEEKMTDFTGDWAKREIKIPKAQPFMANWVTENDIDASVITNEIKLKLAKVLDSVGLFVRYQIVIEAKTRYHLDRNVLLVDNKTVYGKAYYPLKVWPEGVERIPEWDEMLAYRHMPEIPVPVNS